ncbi:MAG: hypothetical protein ACRDLO_07390 [Solirubrobacterales bacterium]
MNGLLGSARIKHLSAKYGNVRLSPIASDRGRVKMKIIDTIERELIREEQPLRGETIVWICPECFDPYDARPPGGKCLNAGHAPVRVFRARVHSIRARRGSPVVPLRPQPA